MKKSPGQKTGAFLFPLKNPTRIKTEEMGSIELIEKAKWDVGLLILKTLSFILLGVLGALSGEMVFLNF